MGGSTFGGIFEEIPNISVDRFNGDNLKSTIYFLSHCHWDHMEGLSAQEFQELLLNRNEVYLYGSNITCQILRGIFPNIAPKLKELPLENPTLIKFPNCDDNYISVTPLPAGHCPGSVMFLFEFEGNNILYTGDYRVTASDLKKYKAFYSLGQLKKFDKMYLDTTFCTTRFPNFPQRKESLDIIVQIVKEWVEKSPKHIIHIKLSARYGSEYLFIELANSIGMPIHVHSYSYDFYKFVPQMDTAVTLDGTATQIHAGCGPQIKMLCTGNTNSELVRTVIPSALYWKNKNIKDGIMTKTGEEYRVCYSCHSSYEEIKEFLLFLQPKKIEPCVDPESPWEKREMQNLIAKVSESWQKLPQKDGQLKLFDVEKRDVIEVSSTDSEGNKEYDDILDDISCSPPKNFKRKRLWLNSDK